MKTAGILHYLALNCCSLVLWYIQKAFSGSLIAHTKGSLLTASCFAIIFPWSWHNLTLGLPKGRSRVWNRNGGTSWVTHLPNVRLEANSSEFKTHFPTGILFLCYSLNHRSSPIPEKERNMYFCKTTEENAAGQRRFIWRFWLRKSSVKSSGKKWLLNQT